MLGEHECTVLSSGELSERRKMAAGCSLLWADFYFFSDIGVQERGICTGLVIHTLFLKGGTVIFLHNGA